MGKRLFVGVIALVLVISGSVGGATTGGKHAGTTDAAVTDRGPAADAAHLPAGSGDAAGQETCNYRRLYDSVSRSVVAINVSNETGPVAGGSGWVYAVDEAAAYVVTNWHVTQNGTDVDVQFSGDQVREASVVGADPATDLAVLRVENAPESVAPLALADQPADHGQPVAVFGNPFGLEESMSTGVVSGLERAVTVQYPNNATSTIPNTVQIDAAVNPGNSGGPLVNCRGRVLGVNYAGAGPVDAGVNFAIDASVVREVAPALVENGTYRHSFLGVRPVTVDTTVADANNLSVARGVMVADVLPGGPADGLLRGAPAVHKQTGAPYDGDVVVAAEGVEIADKEDLLTFLLLETDPGQTVNFTVLRDGENRTVPVTLGERPSLLSTPTNETTRTTTAAPETDSEVDGPAAVGNGTTAPSAVGTD